MSGASCLGPVNPGGSTAELLHGAAIEQLSTATTVGPNFRHSLIRKLELKALERKQYPLQGGVVAIATAQHNGAISQVAVPACQ
jgi:hypothetical protein